MAKVHHRKARKDYPDAGIKKGDMYYTASVKTGPRSSKTIRQLEPIKRWQLTTSSFLSALWQWEDRIEKFDDQSDLEDLISEIRELGEEQYQNYENMPEGLQQGDTGMMLEERSSACEEAANELEEIQHEWSDAETEATEQEFIERVRNIEVAC